MGKTKPKPPVRQCWATFLKGKYRLWTENTREELERYPYWDKGEDLHHVTVIPTAQYRRMQRELKELRDAAKKL